MTGVNCDTATVRMAVVGGGISGLTLSLLAARAGHDVVVIDRDPPRENGDVESAWGHWDRRSVPQFRQIHGYQAVAYGVLRERLPDVLALLHRVGAQDASRVGTVTGADSLPGSDALVQFQCRRSTLEWALRTAAAAEDRIELREATEVNGVVTVGNTNPRVAGARTAAGDITADLVVDAAGRRTQSAAWCADAGLPSVEQVSVDTRQVYFTRWFRARDSAAVAPYTRVELSFATLMVYPADAGWFSVTFFAPAGDAGLRAMLLEPERIVAAARAVPPVAELLQPELVEPYGEVLFMGGLRNHLRRPPANAVVGMVSLADAVVCTNPTWGRGVALAMANAAALVDVVGEFEEPATMSREFNHIAVAQLEPWYHDTVFLDAEVNARWSRQPDGADDAGSSPWTVSLTDALAATRVDPVVSVAWARYRNLLDPPSAFWDDEHIVERVRAAITDGAPPITLDSPSRADISALA
jgi:2-polyprenyl-6-methoxyphenol hydroxylase-like FAD-dependent oxidoreductase